MLTVILYRKSDLISITQYHHVFLKYQLSGQIVMHSWERQNAAELWQDINLITKEHSRWKIIIMDGEHFRSDSKADITMDPAVKELITYLSGQASNRTPLDGLLPEEIWYVVCQKKCALPERRESGPKRLDEEQGFSCKMRTFLFEIETETGMEKEFDLFRLNCALLTLAINEIPYSILQSGYLYRLDLDIDRDEFADYVVYLDHHMKIIRERQELEWENLQNQKKRVVQYPEFKEVEVKIEEGKDELAKGVEPDEIQFKDIKNMEALKHKLSKKREWYHTQMYFPKGVLRGEAAKLQAYVDSVKGTDSFLCEAGKDRLERENEEVLSNMSARLAIWQDQKKIDQDMYDAEEQLQMLAKQVMKCSERRWVLFSLTLIQMFIFTPLFFIQRRFGSLGQMPAYIFWLPLLLFIVLGLLTAGGYFAYQWIAFLEIRNRYQKLFRNHIKNHQKKTLSYLNGMLKLVAKYRFCEKIREEQSRYWTEWNKRREILKMHDAVGERGEIMSQRLMQLLGIEEQKREEEHCVFTIDFSKEPSEEEYYLVSRKRRKYQVELNGEGLMLKAAFEFVKSVTIEKMPEKL